MITASGSIRLTAEAMPVPSASIARSIRCSARWSPWSSARSQMPLVRRGLLVLLHQLEEVGLVALFVLAAGLGFHRRAARVGLHAALRPQGHLAPPRLTTMWPISPAAPRPSQGLPSRTRPPPTPVPQKTPIRLLNSRPAPRWNSASVATWTSLPTRTSVPSASFSVSASGKLPSQSGRFLAEETTPVFSSASPGEPTPTPSSAAVSTPASLGRLAQRRGHLRGDVRRAAAGRRRAARFALDVAAGVDDHGLDLGAAEVDAPRSVGARGAQGFSPKPSLA